MTYLNLSDYELPNINYKQVYLDYIRYNKLDYNYLLDYKYNIGLSYYQLDGYNLKKLLKIIGSDYKYNSGLLDYQKYQLDEYNLKNY